MGEIIVSDAYWELKEEIQQLQAVLAALTSERDDLKYHICPELAARYANEIGDYQNRINYQKIIILETKRRIEIARAALNREKTVSEQEVDDQVHKEYREFHEKVDEEFRKSEQAKRKQQEREEKRRHYEQQWREQYGGSASDEDGDSEDSKGDRKEDSGSGKETDNPSGQEDNDQNQGNDHGSGDRGNSSGDDSQESEREQDSAQKSHLPNARELYRKIVKRLHPDMNPDITEREKELFYKAVQAYKDGDIATLQEIYDEIFGDGAADVMQKELSYKELVELRDKLKERIGQLQAEIDEIKQGFPYRLKEILDNPDYVKQRREELEEQIRQNEETLKRMLKILEEINQEMDELRRKQAAKGK